MQVPGATVPGAAMYNVQCTGDGAAGTRVCRNVVNRWSSGGSYLGGMMSALQVSPVGADPFYFGAFSAGGIVVKVLLTSAADRRRVRAVMLSDAIYGDLGGNEGFVAYAVEAAQSGDRMFVATSSSAGGTGTTPGNIRLGELRREVERRLGASFEEQPPEVWQGIVKYLPVRLWRMGSVWLADYEGTIGHGHTVLAPGLWQKLLQPWDAAASPLLSPFESLPGETPQPLLPGEPSTLARVAVFVGAVVVGYGAVRVFT